MVPEAENYKSGTQPHSLSPYKSGIQPHKIQEMLVLQKSNSGSRWLTCFHLNLNISFAYLGSHFYRDALAKHWLAVFSCFFHPPFRRFFALKRYPCTARLCSWDQQHLFLSHTEGSIACPHRKVTVGHPCGHGIFSKMDTRLN